VFTISADMTAVTTPLTELTDVDAVALANPTRVTVTLDEYGVPVVDTLRLRETSFTAVDPYVADKVAQNMIDSVEELVRTAAIAGTSKVYGGDALARTDIVPGDKLTAALVRRRVAALRKANVRGRRGDLYVGIIHPDVSVDLREETGSGGWRYPHEYQAGTNVWNGEIGVFEGAAFIETTRAGVQEAAGAGGSGTKADVYPTFFLGGEALVEASNIEPEVRMGPVTDKLNRFRTIGWYTFSGWKVLRESAITRVETGYSSDAGYSAT